VNDAGVVDPHHGRTRLQVAAVIARRRKRVLEDAHGLREAGFDVANRRVPVALNVGVRVLRPLREHERIFFGVLVQHERIRLQRFFGIEESRQFFVLYHDRGDRGLGDLRRFGGHGGYELTDEAYPVDCEHGPVAQAAPEVVIADVAAGQHSMHAGHRARLGGVDGDDLCVRHRTRQKVGPEHSGQRKIRRVLGLARCLDRTVDAIFVRAEAICRDRGPRLIERRAHPREPL
jgi:hypothetical protein